MGFTVEDMLLVSRQRYQMKLIAGKGGWSNSISWLLMVEDLTIVQRFSGKELAEVKIPQIDKESNCLSIGNNSMFNSEAYFSGYLDEFRF